MSRMEAIRALIDIRVYEPAMLSEIPYWFPDNMLKGNCLRIGYHTLELRGTESELLEFERWASQHQNILKIIGITPLSGEHSTPVPATDGYDR